MIFNEVTRCQRELYELGKKRVSRVDNIKGRQKITLRSSPFFRSDFILYIHMRLIVFTKAQISVLCDAQGWYAILTHCSSKNKYKCNVLVTNVLCELSFIILNIARFRVIVNSATKLKKIV